MEIEVVVVLLIACGVCAFAGSIGGFPFAWMMIGFAAAGWVGAWANHAPAGSPLMLLAPAAFGLGAAGLKVSIDRDRYRREHRGQNPCN